MELYLRKANKFDKKITYNWVNDRLSRENSFNEENVPFEVHEKWFENTLEREDRDLFICMDFMMPVGEIRLDYSEGNTAVISYMVDERARGNGYGLKLLHLVEKEAVKKYPEGITLYGEVKPENIASITVFKNAGYEVSELSNDTRIVFEKYVDKESVSKSKKPSKLRDTNFEILRVIAMLMVITLHYIGKGALIAPSNLDIKKAEIPFWIIECLCIVCVNVYVLISGYYMVDKNFKLSKLATLWLQIFFYSICVSVAALLLGYVSFNDLYVLYKQFIIFPVTMGHYWFATAYIIMYMLSPFLVKAMRAMDKRMHRLLIFLILIPLCFAKSIIPYDVATDDKGITFVWFIALFIIAGYIKLYGIKFFEKKSACVFAYIMSAAAILGFRYLAVILTKTFPEWYLYTKVTNYNFIFVLTGSLGLFCFFKNIKFKNGIIVRCISRIAPYTFGVYLLHEHICVRYTWISEFDVTNPNLKNRPLHMLLTILIIFLVGVIIDFIRSLIFKVVGKVVNFGLKIYYSYREIMDYLIFGVLATIVNWVAYLGSAYFVLKLFMKEGSTALFMVANIIAWIAAVLFAYWTNRNFVFRSKITGFVPRLKEFWQFIAARIFSFLVETLLFFIMIDTLGLNDILAKVLISVVVIILNYIFSKLWVFKSGEKKKNADKQ